MPFLPGDGPGRISRRGSLRREGIQHLQAGDISPLARPVRGKGRKVRARIGWVDYRGKCPRSCVSNDVPGRIASTFFSEPSRAFPGICPLFSLAVLPGLATQRIASGTRTRAQSILCSLLASSIARGLYSAVPLATTAASKEPRVL